MQIFKKVLIEKPLFENFFNINFKLNNTYYVGYNMRYHRNCLSQEVFIWKENKFL